MTTTASVVASLILDSGKFVSGLGQADKATDSFIRKWKSVGDQMKKTGAIMTASVTLPIVAFAKKSVDAYMVQEAALAELDAVIASTGGNAGLTRNELEKMAAGLQKITKFGDEAILSGQSMLLTFTNIKKDVFEDATVAMLNMAEKFGSIEQASIQLGKALNDPIQGVAALRRVGIQLSAQQEQQIKDFMAVGDIASAQRVILKELEVQFGGLAEAAAKTSSGQLQQLKNVFGDLQEKLGGALIPVLLSFTKAMIPLIEKFVEAPPWVHKTVMVFLLLLAVLGPIIFLLGSFISVITTIGPGIVTAAAFITGTLIPALTTLFTFITATAIPAIVAFTIANAGWIVPLLIVAATVFLVYKAFKTNFMGISTTVKQLWFIIKAAFGGIVSAIMTVIKATLAMMATFAKVKLPPALTPGSPTPFEMGLRGIRQAMDELSDQSLPKLQAGFSAPGVANAGSSTYIDNRTFAGGMSGDELRAALDDRFKKINKRMK